MEKLYIVDASNYLFRSYFAIRQMTNDKGVSTNALFGFIRSIKKLIKDFSPTHLVVVFDGPNNKKSRLALYEDYKGHRASMPDDLFPQIEFAKEYCESAGIPHIEVEGVEADDTIGSIAVWAAKRGAQSFLCSSDKDLCQLVNDRIFVLNTFKENLIIDRKEVEKIYGIRPEQMIDYLAIVGDTSDNIPGIKGFGPKTASALLSNFDTLDTILKHPEKIGNAKKEAKIAEERQNALLSRQLAKIDQNIPIPQTEKSYELTAPDEAKLVALYQEMNFNTFLRELAGEISEKSRKKASSDKKIQTHYSQIKTLEELQALISDLEKQPEVSVDVETTSINPMEAEIVGVGLGFEEGKAWYIPFNAEMNPKKLTKILQSFFANEAISFFAHNIKYDMHVLKRAGLDIASVGFDTMLASYLLSAHNNRHGLDELSLMHFDHRKISLKELAGAKTKKGIKAQDIAIDKMTEYCCEDIDFTIRLKNLFEKELEKRKLKDLYFSIELPLLLVLFEMEENGIFLDVPYMEKLSKDFQQKLVKIEEEIYKIAGKEFNIKSPKQLSEVLFDTLKMRSVGKKKQTGYSTSADVLKELEKEHPIIKKITEFRGLEKLRSTYVDALPKQINPETGRIHCSFNQSVTTTGRLSSTNPNLQNIPIRTTEGRKVRTAFRPEKKGWSYLSADYSQIELRILAHMSNDPELVKAFKSDEDIHLFTASRVFDVPLDKVTKEMRSRAKAVNFGLIYGQQAFGLSKELGIDIREANAFITTYFKRYPKVKEFLESCKDRATKEGKAVSLYNRERLLPEIKSKNAVERAAAMRLAVNTPIQGTQADIIKIAMIQIDEALAKENFDTMMILQIHDELIFECPDAEISKCKKIIQSIMEGVIDLKVPLRVDISVGKNWGEC